MAQLFPVVNTREMVSSTVPIAFEFVWAFLKAVVYFFWLFLKVFWLPIIIILFLFGFLLLIKYRK
ncbi:MAG: hypothetical protein A3J93_00115 [Candidatus Magasanikbacteria bacterium RIFOXYC2_FULL_42_28]|uniref:Uncharacterized protein n=1 Tax=Candidatus Magasanikbacteria bacterium RIFOXYC2_FULL_42_28 TaxID=1798704 RepID=A0A1F6NWW5_9BACT|nr:MAG: hypothetical protein A3J93_00115 [Candidatus Magasanikbacteria bacterium RIFOXYC2_FULL_42_28]